MHRQRLGPETTLQWVALGASLAGLALIYLFQQLDYVGIVFRMLGMHQAPTPALSFVVNRTFRLILNDSFCLILILFIFHDKRFNRTAFYVFLTELFLLLPAYLALKLTLEGPSEISSPLLSPIHRMIVNPLLMIVMIVAFYYQVWRETNHDSSF